MRPKGVKSKSTVASSIRKVLGRQKVEGQTTSVNLNSAAPGGGEGGKGAWGDGTLKKFEGDILSLFRQSFEPENFFWGKKLEMVTTVPE